MRWSVFKHTLHDGWQDVLLWGGGIGLMGLLITAMVPAFESFELVGFLEGMPPALLALAGFGEDLESLATPEGIIAAGFFSKMVLIFTVYPVVMGLRITANDEDKGIMDTVLSLPVSRQRLMLEKFLAYSLLIIAVMVVATLGLLAGTVVNGVEVNNGLLIILSISLVPMLIFVLALTAFLGAVFPRKQMVIGVMTGIIAGSFLLYTVATMITADWIAIPAALSFFSYYDPQTILSRGSMMPLELTVLTGAALLLMGSSLWLFERRDLA
jgi:ABC-2 type transport system permease protein